MLSPNQSCHSCICSFGHGLFVVDGILCGCGHHLSVVVSILTHLSLSVVQHNNLNQPMPYTRKISLCYGILWDHIGLFFWINCKCNWLLILHTPQPGHARMHTRMRTHTHTHTHVHTHTHTTHTARIHNQDNTPYTARYKKVCIYTVCYTLHCDWAFVGRKPECRQPVAIFVA